mmetsp:Transcript_8538/g.7560  ORF Transcript_8538/g.7560 Transcript_8538/m.7560 type:complete len:114 (+) Transcript_8538:95-436(+)
MMIRKREKKSLNKSKFIKGVNKAKMINKMTKAFKNSQLSKSYDPPFIKRVNSHLAYCEEQLNNKSLSSYNSRFSFQNSRSQSLNPTSKKDQLAFIRKRKREAEDLRKIKQKEF